MSKQVGRNDLCPCGSGKKYKKCCLSRRATLSEPILLLFGAGASLGSGGLNHIPPSGDTLYEKLTKKYATWQTIPSESSEIFKESFEKGMSSLYINETIESQYNLANLLADMGIYFSTFSIDKPSENFYCALFNKYKSQINSRKILLSTLNYECLVEFALSIQGMDKVIYTGDEYTGVKLLKLHGSCNFIPKGFSRDRQNSRLVMSRGILNTEWEPVKPADVEKALITAPFPVMSLYTKEKNNIVNPKEIQRIQSEFQQCVNQAKVIITIGVKPDPEDRHIWDYVSKSKAELFLVGNPKNCQNWIDKCRLGNGNVLGHYFQDSFHDICNLLDRFA